MYATNLLLQLHYIMVVRKRRVKLRQFPAKLGRRTKIYDHVTAKRAYVIRALLCGTVLTPEVS